ncbi:hypothetical protein NP233_g12288 [Leucocoprinus birnbaumii]|uniref:Uncharacterized protein n=1 Tax=Leucocoprinus birnbaumii TaxID=56174 RepID=A0AAD5VFD6_9AGAR|nr:hypothetical protein NP233_g12288 [Leucocoprinus birnbaumii]
MSLSPTPSQPDPTTSHNLGDENAALRRQLQDTQEELREATQEVPKRPFTTRTLGRAIRRLVSCFESISSLTAEADRRVIAAAEGIVDPPPITDEDVELATARNRTFTGYQLLIEVAPQIPDLMKKPNSNELKSYIKRLQAGANSGRTDDNSRLKWEVAKWINDAYKLGPAERLSTEDRDNRGFQHDICGELLAPIDIDWNDLTVREDIRNGTSEVNPNDSYFLRCLYHNGQGDPNNVEEGFLRSHWLLLVFHAIFLSPSVDEDQYRDEELDGPPQKKRKISAKARSNVSTILNMNGKITGRVIAYVAVLFVFNLHDISTWRECHNGFSFDEFYNFIVDFFEDTPDAQSKARVRSLLNWWNRKIFPHKATASSNPRQSRKKLAAQRAAAARP